MTMTKGQKQRIALAAAKAEAFQLLFNDDGKTLCPECGAVDSVVEVAPVTTTYGLHVSEGEWVFTDALDARQYAASEFACRACRKDVTLDFRVLVALV
jgi:hypothetical protein